MHQTVDPSTEPTLRAAARLTALALVLGLGGALLLGLAPRAIGQTEATGATGQDEAVETARAAADALTRDLMGTLAKTLSDSGPGEAIRVCSEVAQEVAAEHSTDGVTVRRVSRRVRNPADRPDTYEAAQLERLAVLQAEGDLPGEVIEVVEGEDGGKALRYLRPITLKALCLQCHGSADELAPEVQSVLAERYPEDEATGYRAGDLRGAVSVTVALE